MKKIELTPEWILDKLTVTHYADGTGKVLITTDTDSDSCWIELALDSLGVKYETCTLCYDPDHSKRFFESQWEFKIEDIKADCPILYNRWKMTDDINAFHIWQTQQALDSIKTK